MIKFYRKRELAFSLICIGAYVVLFSAADNISSIIGIKSVLTASISLAFCVFLLIFIMRGDFAGKFGLRGFEGSVVRYLFFIPLLALASCNLWNGAELSMSTTETALFVVKMLCVGFIEEILFRGFLFNALTKDNKKLAVLISSLTFGAGHLVNLFNGVDFLSTVLQICYAAAIGFLFTIIFMRSKSLWPCIITHAAINSLSAFSVDGDVTFNIITSLILIVVSVGYALFIIKFCKDRKHEST